MVAILVLFLLHPSARVKRALQLQGPTPVAASCYCVHAFSLVLATFVLHSLHLHWCLVAYSLSLGKEQTMHFKVDQICIKNINIYNTK